MTELVLIGLLVLVVFLMWRRPPAATPNAIAPDDRRIVLEVIDAFLSGGNKAMIDRLTVGDVATADAIDRTLGELTNLTDSLDTSVSLASQYAEELNSKDGGTRKVITTKEGWVAEMDQAHGCMPMRAVLRFLGVSASRFHAWRRREAACALDDQSSCPRTSPHRLTLAEVQAIGDMVTAPRVPSRPHRDARDPRAAARQRIGVARDLVPPRPEVRLATPSAPDASSQAEGGAAHDGT